MMDPSATDPMTGLRSRRTADRIAAVRAIRRSKDRSLADGLIMVLEDRSNLVVAEAASAIRDWGLEEAIDPMARRYRWLAESGAKRDPGCLARKEIVAAFAV